MKFPRPDVPVAPPGRSEPAHPTGEPAEPANGPHGPPLHRVDFPRRVGPVAPGAPPAEWPQLPSRDRFGRFGVADDRGPGVQSTLPPSVSGWDVPPPRR